MENKLQNFENTLEKDQFSNGKTETFILNDKLGFPKVIKRKDESIELSDLINENREQYEEDLRKYGAILARGFNIDTVEKFKEVTQGFQKESLAYTLRSSPRYEITENVYVSTTYPEDESINMHSESSYAPSHPSKIIFCCIIPAAYRGETPIADNRLIVRNIREDILEKFKNTGVIYKRNLTGLLGMSWEEVFQTSDKIEVEEDCIKNGMDFKWISDTHLELSWKKKAIWEHPVTGELVWFNHAMFFNKYSFSEDLLDFISSDDELPNNTYYGDGSEISKEEIENIKEAYQKAIVEFPWEKGDVLFLDNMLMSHGRNPYKGDRKIIVSIS
jgi:alpha-ketoglutarate-dependent taurine dioxygenase